MSDNKMPGQFLPTWAITTLVIVLTVFGTIFVIGLLAGTW